MDEPLILERPDPAILVLRLNRPEVRNAVNPPLRAALRRALEEAAEHPAVSVVILTGGPDIFSAGADLKALNQPGGTVNTGSVEMWTALNSFPKPLIAAVEGHAVGVGCEIALAADMVVAGRNATLRLPEVKRGFLPGAGGTQRMIRAAGKARAMRFVMTAAPIDAATAADWGLLSDLVEPGQALVRAIELAREIASMPSACILAVKRLMVDGPDMPLPQAMVMERAALRELLDSPDRHRLSQGFLDGKSK
ncbi:enoyl-CoA hydratase [Frigidibacter albus]|uniref:Enoyl-CoA hydratase n=1 Tax=Frigidibacter albus TaxID=1465486 RepID=A0A6L8VL51_9RHOB|nr:enoyl-CoA hydratase-related protein [Frigidibacter albus]MZQ91107.1 enoyl-CoA hydratase [Frigidibacter albus]NBE32992.1 enoyl-CoA hydratase [Frigidibacter albus]GGH62814.1 enoyl-CoA hydratase [Frigidibacter albus]